MASSHENNEDILEYQHVNVIQEQEADIKYRSIIDDEKEINLEVHDETHRIFTRRGVRGDAKTPNHDGIQWCWNRWKVLQVVPLVRRDLDIGNGSKIVPSVIDSFKEEIKMSLKRGLKELHNCMNQISRGPHS
ncbi:hypothetical protein HAX54_033354 [Datura stramonium]|uniref:Uncharacterized protein n=1 Tax=Datura stramonium TaxID=4076 RepID=A0ABS8VEW4_DATST|nr:hypothetical protein [Datura stramonium]